jgi:hypothetical protein
MALLGSGALFLIEAGMGLFNPQVYSIVERSSREEAPWRLPMIGALLFVWSLFCLKAGMPPIGVGDWAVAMLSLAFFTKSSLLILFPSSLNDTPQAIMADPPKWRGKCIRRTVLGVLLASWGIVLMSS